MHFILRQTGVDLSDEKYAQFFQIHNKGYAAVTHTITKMIQVTTLRIL